MKKLKRSFYSRNTLQVAEELLGKYLVRKLQDKLLIGKIVEVEATWERMIRLLIPMEAEELKETEVMYGEAGHIAVYFIYGMHYCFNVITERVNVPRGYLSEP